MSSEKPKGQQFRYVDRPEVEETYADTVENFFFDGATLKLEFLVYRWDEPKPPKMPSGRKYPACRLVLARNGALELYNKLHQLMSALEAQGAIKRDAPAVVEAPKTVQ